MNLLRVILSSTYVSEDLIVELGRIPPSMMPLRGKMLFEHQASNSPTTKNIISLPECYKLSEHQSEAINRRNIDITRVPSSNSIGEALAIVIGNYRPDVPLEITFGDTVADYDGFPENSIMVNHASGYYEWSVYDTQNNVFLPNSFERPENLVMSGCFKFSNVGMLIDSLKKEGNNFIGAINALLSSGEISIFESAQVFDFGHVKTYFQSRKSFTTERHFNHLTFDEDYIIKKSKNRIKLACEYTWFKSCPGDLKIYTPSTIPLKSDGGYKIEYLNLMPLNELLVYGELQPHIWESIFSSIRRFLDKCDVPIIDENLGGWDIIENTRKRLCLINQPMKNRLKIVLNKANMSFGDILNDLSLYIEGWDERRSIIHGDLCFSNILYDTRSQRIKVIDPRGCDFDGFETNFGPMMYDYAKLAHSVFGHYDDIISGKYRFIFEEDVPVGLIFLDECKNRAIEEIYWQVIVKDRLDKTAIYGITCLLFLSMLPLHEDSEERQMALFLNALRLHKELKEVV